MEDFFSGGIYYYSIIIIIVIKHTTLTVGLWFYDKKIELQSKSNILNDLHHIKDLICVYPKCYLQTIQPNKLSKDILGTRPGLTIQQMRQILLPKVCIIVHHL